MGRRAFGLGVASIAAAMPALAQSDFPKRPVTAYVGFAAGSVNDVVGRIVADIMSRELGVPVIIDNRPGAASAISAGAVLRAPADGYTILFGSNSMLVNHILHPDQPPTDPEKDFDPVGTMADLPLMFHIHPDVPAANLKELLDYAVANPGRLSCGTVGQASIGHLALELLMQQARAEIVHVPYRAPAVILQDLFAGRIHIAVSSPMRHAQSRILAVTTAGRFSGLPEIPTVNESLQLTDYDVAAWQGVFVRAGTPTDISRRIESALSKATTDPSVASRSIPAGAVITPGNGAALATLVKRDLVRWRALITTRGIRAG